MEVAISAPDLAVRDGPDEIISLVQLGIVIRHQVWWIAGITLIAAAMAWIVTSLMSPAYTARATLLPARQQQASTALSSLGVLAGAVGSVVAHTGEQYVSFLGSRYIGERIVARFKLAEDDSPAALDVALRLLMQRVHFELNRKDNLLIVQAIDHDPQRAADITNAYIEELHQLTRGLFISAVAERRVALEHELAVSAQLLSAAEAELQRTEFNAGDLRIDTRATADRYRQVQTQLALAEIRLHGRSATLTPMAPEVQQAQALVTALRRQLAQLEQVATGASSEAKGYADAQRRYRLREHTHGNLARQVEQLHLEEARGVPPLPVLDAAMPPQRASAPRRIRTTLLATAAAAVLSLLVLVLRAFWRTRPDTSTSAPAPAPAA